MSDRADALVLFGITGDLAAKKLFTSLYNLACRGLLPEVVVGVARSEWDLDTLREHARGALEAAGVEVREQVFAELAGALAYVGGDYREPDTFARLRDAVGGCERVACYLAIPPALFGDVVEGLAAVGLNEGGRVILEKPFGRDLASAQELNATLHRHYPEESIFRIDHFLGKASVQNLMVFRFANTKVWARALADYDPLATELFDTAIDAVAVGVASVVNMLDVERVVVGGGLAEKLGQHLADRIADAAQPWMLQPHPELRFVVAALGDDSGVIGAAALGRELVTLR